MHTVSQLLGPTGSLGYRSLGRPAENVQIRPPHFPLRRPITQPVVENANNNSAEAGKRNQQQKNQTEPDWADGQPGC